MRDASRVSLRSRRDDDVDVLTQLMAVTRDRDGYPPHWPPDTGRFIASRRELASFVSEDETGAVVGHVALNASSARPCMELARAATGYDDDQLGAVARLVVAPQMRRHGIARQLLEAATRRCFELGRHPILDVVQWFDPAIALYETAGWQRIGDVTISFRSPCSDLCSHAGNSIDSYVYIARTPAEPTAAG